MFFIYNIVYIFMYCNWELFSAGCQPLITKLISNGRSISVSVPVGGTAFYLCDLDAALVDNNTIVCPGGST